LQSIAGHGQAPFLTELIIVTDHGTIAAPRAVQEPLAPDRRRWEVFIIIAKLPLNVGMLAGS